MTIKDFFNEKELYCSTKDDFVKKDCLNAIVNYNKELLSKYPWLYPINSWDSYELGNYDYSFTELDSMPKGWRLAFGDAICEEIQQELVKYDAVNTYRLLQVKEKYGSLRWYDTGIPIGKLSDSYIVLSLTQDERRSKYPQYANSQYIWKDFDVEHYILPFSEEAKSLSREELKEYNSEAVYHYRVYKILEKCRISYIIDKYESISARTCILCGKPATWESKGWISPYCDSCAANSATNSKRKNITIQDLFVPID